MDIFNTLSKFVTDCLGYLLLKYGLRTSVGALFGGILVFANRVLGNLYSDPKTNPLKDVEDGLFVIIGLFILYIPSFIDLMKNKPEFDEQIENAFLAIDKAGNESLTKTQKNQLYIKLCEKIVANVTPQEVSKMKPQKSKSGNQ